MVLTWENRNTRSKTSLIVTLSTTEPTWAGLRLGFVFTYVGAGIAQSV